MRGLLPILLTKLGGLLGAFFAASLVLFAAVRLIPGDPVALRFKNPDPARVEEIRQNLGLNDPLPAQYGRYVGGFVTGDWGRGLLNGRPVAGEFRGAFTATLELTLAALLWGVPFGAAAALAGAGLGGWRRRLVSALGGVGLTIPIFWLGLVGLVVFTHWLSWLPGGGRWDFADIAPPERTGFLLVDSLLAGDGTAFAATLRHLALPAFCLGLFPAALVAGTLTTRLEEPSVEVLTRALAARGLSPWRLRGRHLLKLSAAPLAVLIGTNFGALLGGAVITESLFSWPGMGRLLMTAVLERDVPVVENALLAVLLLSFLIAALADAAATLLDPHLRRKGNA